MIKINKTYVINLKKRTDRWCQINKNFKNSGLKLNKWDAIYGKDLSEEKIKEITNKFCYYLCSPSMIGIWMSHYTLWQHIAKNNETNVLILEDDAYPAKDFNLRVKSVLSKIPKDYDMFYFGCIGTCDKGYNDMSKAILGESNKIVYDENNNEIQEIFRPYFPLALHGYMVSNKGAKKLINNEKFKKIAYHIDTALPLLIFNDKQNNFNVYATAPPLIEQEFGLDSDNIISNHPVIGYPLSKIKVSETMNLDYVSNIQSFYLRHLGIPITEFLLFMVIFSLVMGAILPTHSLNYLLIFIIGIYLVEIIITKGKTIKLMVFELIVIILVSFLSNSIANNIRK